LLLFWDLVSSVQYIPSEFLNLHSLYLNLNTRWSFWSQILLLIEFRFFPYFFSKHILCCIKVQYFALWWWWCSSSGSGSSSSSSNYYCLSLCYSSLSVNVQEIKKRASRKNMYFNQQLLLRLYKYAIIRLYTIFIFFFAAWDRLDSEAETCRYWLKFRVGLTARSISLLLLLLLNTLCHTLCSYKHTSRQKL
jgi:hypothetical protein